MSNGTNGASVEAQKSLDKPSAWATALLIRALVADDAMAATVTDTAGYRRLLIERLNGFIAEAGGPAFDVPKLQEVPVIDLKVVGYDYLMEVAHGATWLPPEYTENDILADIRSWLETSYVHGLDAAVDVASPEFLAHFDEWWEKHGQYLRAGGGEYQKTFAYHAAQHYTLCARSEAGWRASVGSVRALPDGFAINAFDGVHGLEIAVGCPSGNGITVGNRGRLAERVLFELARALRGAATSRSDDPST